MRFSSALALCLASTTGAMSVSSNDARPPLRRSTMSRGQIDGKVVVWPPPWVPASIADALVPELAEQSRDAEPEVAPPRAYTPPSTVTPITPISPSGYSGAAPSTMSGAAAAPGSQLVSGRRGGGAFATMNLVAANIMEGGALEAEKGSTLLGAQVVLCACVAGGDIPAIGDLLRIDVGTLAILGGFGSIALGSLELGPALSPWTLPAENERSELRTDGIYGFARHPMYAGLLLTCLGFAVLTDSATRLVLSAALAFVLNQKAALEEEALNAKYGAAYAAYEDKVRPKFFPFLF